VKIALIIPTRGDRPDFIRQCKKMIHRQTVPPDDIIFIDFKGKEGIKDITQRYRLGIKKAVERGNDVAFFWEDDDWYHPRYIEWMIGEWIRHGMPDLFGIAETYYYHIKVESLWKTQHPGRASAFSTLVNLNDHRGNIRTWCDDTDPFTDMWIWREWKNRKVAIPFPKGEIYAIGVKHGIGLTGGSGHSHANLRWTQQKAEGWFNTNILPEDIVFYQKIKRLLPK
jgi:hypothetical protein